MQVTGSQQGRTVFFSILNEGKAGQIFLYIDEDLQRNLQLYKIRGEKIKIHEQSIYLKILENTQELGRNEEIAKDKTRHYETEKKITIKPNLKKTNKIAKSLVKRTIAMKEGTNKQVQAWKRQYSIEPPRLNINVRIL